jgi:hypothetical protein
MSMHVHRCFAFVLFSIQFSFFFIVLFLPSVLCGRYTYKYTYMRSLRSIYDRMHLRRRVTTCINIPLVYTSYPLWSYLKSSDRNSETGKLFFLMFIEVEEGVEGAQPPPTTRLRRGGGWFMRSRCQEGRPKSKMDRDITTGVQTLHYVSCKALAVVHCLCSSEFPSALASTTLHLGTLLEPRQQTSGLFCRP